MDLVAIELLLWLGFAVLIWALKDSLYQMESELQEYRFPAAAHQAMRRDRIVIPQTLIEPIGHYLDQMIYRYAIIEGRHYCFDHVCPAGMTLRLDDRQRCISPGLIYVEAYAPLA